MSSNKRRAESTRSELNHTSDTQESRTAYGQAPRSIDWEYLMTKEPPSVVKAIQGRDDNCSSECVKSAAHWQPTEDMYPSQQRLCMNSKGEHRGERARSKHTHTAVYVHTLSEDSKHAHHTSHSSTTSACHWCKRRENMTRP